MKKLFLTLCLAVIFASVVYSQSSVNYELVPRDYLGTIAKCVVNDNKLNVRLFPNTKSKIIGQLNQGDVVEVKGFSDNRELIDGYNGYWVKISMKSSETLKDYAGDYSGKFGWIFSKYINIDRKLDVSTMKVLNKELDSNKNVKSLQINLQRNGENTEIKVFPRKFSTQENYYFTWSDDNENFLFSDPVGTFRWNPKTNKIQHISFLGYESESAWCIASDDDKYLFQDFGTGPGIRSFSVYEISTNKVLLRGNYLHSLDFDGKYVTVVEDCSDWNIREGQVSKESLKHYNSYKAKLSPNELTSKSIVVRYRLNLETLKKTFLDCTTIYVQ